MDFLISFKWMKSGIFNIKDMISSKVIQRCLTMLDPHSLNPPNVQSPIYYYFLIYDIYCLIYVILCIFEFVTIPYVPKIHKHIVAPQNLFFLFSDGFSCFEQTSFKTFQAKIFCWDVKPMRRPINCYYSMLMWWLFLRSSLFIDQLLYVKSLNVNSKITNILCFYTKEGKRSDLIWFLK